MLTRKLARAVLRTTIAVTSVSMFLPAPAVAATTSQTVTFSAGTAAIANPERGFYRYSDTHLTGDAQSYQRLDPVALANQRTKEGVTLVFRYFYLDGYPDRDTIAPVDLGLIRADLVAARQAGVKLIIRFAYTATSAADAPLQRVILHIRQLAPVLNENADVIAALQAGFIGRWGEWYYTANFATDPTQPWKLTDADWQAREQVLRTILTEVKSTIPVQVRYPAIKQRVESTLTAAESRRIGIHNDCFLASADDYGTFTGDADRDWLATTSRAALTGGESCAVNAPRSEWTSAAGDLAKYHFTYLNADFHREVLDSWGTGRDLATRNLGYRLHLAQTTVPVGVGPGQPATVRIRLINTGYAAPVTNRPVSLILKSAAQTITVNVATDTRNWAPGQNIDLTATFTAPSQAGSYRLLLNLPDPSSALATQLPLINGDSTNSAYAIRLANSAGWDAQRGWNDLQTTFTVSAA